MKRIFVIVCCIMLLLFSACTAQKTEPEFVAPTPAINPEPTPIPEPAPTEKPKSEYNELLEQLRYGSTESTGMRVRPYYERLHGLEGGSQLIVLATILKKEHIEYRTDYGTWEGYQEGTALIHKVYKGDGVKEGSTIDLREYINIPTYEDGSRAVISLGTYFFPTKEYSTYLLFLEKGDGEYYLPTDEHCGKYPVNPAIAEAYEADALTYDLMEILQNDKMGDARDRNVPPQEFVNLHKEVYAKYYTDEAIQKSLEEQRKYEEHYGRPEPAPTFEPVPEGDSILWAYAWYGKNVIYLPAETITDGGSVAEIHKRMNEAGFDAAQLQKLALDSSDVKLWMKDYDVVPGDKYGTETMISVFRLNGECIQSNLEDTYFKFIASDNNFEPVVCSVTTKLHNLDENTVYHAFFVIEFDESEFLR